VSRSVMAACGTRGFAKCARALTPPNRQCSVFNSVRRRRGGRRPMWSIPDQPRKSEDTLTTDIRKPPTMWRPAWRVIQLLTASMLPRQPVAAAGSL